MQTHFRDAVGVLVSLLFQTIGSAIGRVRTSVFRIGPVLPSAVFGLLTFSPGLTLSNSFFSFFLLVLLSVGSFFIRLRAYWDDSSHRSCWALTRTRDTKTLWQQEFVDAIFTVILRVKDDRIEPPCNLLVVYVANLSFLVSKNDRGQFQPELMALVEEVTITRKPAKRNWLVRAKNSDEEFCCSICVYYDLHADSTVIGIEIRENWWQHTTVNESRKLRGFRL
jgi:hypothetical protein